MFITQILETNVKMYRKRHVQYISISAHIS